MFGARGDQFRQAQIRQLTQAGPPYYRLPHQGNDRHAHPKTVEAGRVPIVGDRIQSDVDAVVVPQILGTGLVNDEHHPLRANSFLNQQVQNLPAMRAFPGQDRQPRTRDGRKNLRPKLEDLRIDLAEVVKAAERDIALLCRWQGVDRRLAVQRIVTPKGLRQANRFLRVASVEKTGRIEVRIGDAIVDRPKARRARIGQPRDLHGRRLAGEDQQAIVGHVHGQVDEDVDPVLADRCGHLLVVQSDDAPPAVGVAAQPLRDGIGTGDVGVAEDLEMLGDRAREKIGTVKRAWQWPRKSGET